MRQRVAAAFAVVVGFSVSAPLFAHHGGSTIYIDRTVTLKGIVKTWYWSNPHCLLTVSVTGDDGTVVDWMTELQAPNTIRPLGFRKDSFQAGDELTITVQLTKNDTPYGRLNLVVLADGTELDPLAFRSGAGGSGGEAQ
jgi:hypothetical protein